MMVVIYIHSYTCVFMVHISTFSLQCYRRVGFVTLSDTGERKVAQIFNFSS